MAAGARTDTAEGGEENFDEAAAAVLKTISTPTLPSSVKVVFDYEPNEVWSSLYSKELTNIKKNMRKQRQAFGSLPAQSRNFMKSTNSSRCPAQFPT